MADQTGQEVAESNKTTLGLYVWPQDAYAMWQADPQHVHILDVRTSEEYVFGGHDPGAVRHRGRGAMAVNLLAQAGFTTVYNSVTGFEGDRVDDPGSVFHGKHMRNGWKNADRPWGCDFHPALMWEEPQ